MNRYASLALALCAVAVAACGDKAAQDISAPLTGANVKFANFAVGAPGVNFYAGSTKLTAISSTSCQPPNDTTSVCRTNGVESTTGTAYNALGSGGLYNQIAPGAVTLAGKISAAADNGLAVSTVSTTLESGKFYTYFMGGVYDAAGKKADAFVVEDALPAVDYAQAFVRLVNTISGSPTVSVSVKSQTTGTTTAVGGAVAYKSANTFLGVAPGVYDLTMSGTGFTPVTALGVNLVAGHVYSIVARGDPASAVAANKPLLTVFAHR